jgi:hypothetical protein
MESSREFSGTTTCSPFPPLVFSHALSPSSESSVRTKAPRYGRGAARSSRSVAHTGMRACWALDESAGRHVVCGGRLCGGCRTRFPVPGQDVSILMATAWRFERLFSFLRRRVTPAVMQ